MKIGFTEFCPKECVLPGSSGTHSVCVCTKHQNVKLMVVSIVQIFQHYLILKSLVYQHWTADMTTITYATTCIVLPFSNATHHRKYVSLENVVTLPRMSHSKN